VKEKGKKVFSIQHQLNIPQYFTTTTTHNADRDSKKKTSHEGLSSSTKFFLSTIFLRFEKDRQT
jgi:hypothetical protein